MASLKVNLKGIGDFECTGNPEFISPEIEKFYAAVFSDAELESCTEPGCENQKILNRSAHMIHRMFLHNHKDSRIRS